MRRLAADGRRLFKRVLVVTALMALRLSVSSGEPIPLKDVVTPSSVLMKDGKPVMFAIHGFIAFRSLAEVFPYVESQRKRWKGKVSEEELTGLEKALVREAVESRVVSRSAAMSTKADLELSIRLRPKYVRTCYVCGPDNARGLQVAFLADGAHGSRALYTARPEHEGWPGLLHGGVTFSLMDEALGWAVHFQVLYGVTARIDTRFRRPIPIGMRVVIKAWTIDQRRRIATARAEVRAEAEGQSLLAEADATIFLQESENQK